MDDLQHCSARMEAKTLDMYSRVKFIEGLLPSIHKWALMVPDIYMSDNDKFVPKLRDRMSAQKAASGKFRVAVSSAGTNLYRTI